MINFLPFFFASFNRVRIPSRSRRKTSLSLYSQAQAWHARDLDECNAPTPVNKGPAGKELTCIGSEKDDHADDAYD